MSKKNTKAAGAAGEQPAIYVVVNPLTYGEPEVRRERGEEVTDIPAASIPWLLEQGHIKLKGGDADGR